jgi:hypothetical protein
MPNKEITLQFARSLIIQSQGEEINWAEFAVSGQKKRKNMRQTKAQNLKNKNSEDVSHVNTMGKKHYCEMKDTLGKRKDKLDLSPAWIESDLRDMASVIDNSKKELEECRLSLSNGLLKRRS